MAAPRELKKAFTQFSLLTGLNVCIFNESEHFAICNAENPPFCMQVMGDKPLTSPYCRKCGEKLLARLRPGRDDKIVDCGNGMRFGLAGLCNPEGQRVWLAVGPSVGSREPGLKEMKRAGRCSLSMAELRTIHETLPVYSGDELEAAASLAQARLKSYYAEHQGYEAAGDCCEALASEATEELKYALAELETIFDNSLVGIVLLKGGRFIAKCNQRVADVIGYDSPQDMVGRSVIDFHINPEEFAEFGKKYFETLQWGERIHVEYIARHKNGHPVYCWASGKAVDNNVPADLDKGVIWVLDDISQQREAEAELRKLATTDHLTGISNRRHFLTMAGGEMDRHRRYGAGFCLLMMDLDHFKQVNDRYGHHVGDEVLAAFGGLLKESLRNVDLMGRLGGEEFAALLPQTGMPQAESVAERIRTGVEAMKLENEAEPVSITVSIGLAACSGKDGELEEIIRRADRALYAAKESGRNRVEISSEDV